ncbi:MAG TPA: hypothetical protein VE130_06775, partial [Nitrososphaeraceae archaeon]|nr:hypothetical protein [Nitrososphaeraceae archaeon]
MGTQVESAELEFLKELKQQFERAVDLRKNLDTKANTMITIAGAISTLLLAIATFLITKINPADGIPTWPIAIFSLGIISAIMAISFFIRSYSIKKYYHPMGAKYFFNKDELLEENIDRFRNYPKEKFAGYLIKEYLKAIKSFSEKNSSKSRNIRVGQVCLLS